MFEDKVAIVTGGASGIGREMCLYMARRGATVVVADIDEDAGDEVVRKCRLKGAAHALFVKTDVSLHHDVEEMVKETESRFGKIDLMINNAGIGLDGEFKDMSLEQWEKVMDIDFWGVLYGTHFVYPIMIRQGYGQIVNVSSLAGLMPGGLMTSYVASKHAVSGFTISLRPEAQLYGVKVNLLCPGFIETAMHDNTEKVSAYLKLEKNQRDKSRYPTADQCIDAMMRGIEKDRAIIIAPGGQKLYWWVYRLFPWAVPLMWRWMIRRLKKAEPDAA